MASEEGELQKLNQDSAYHSDSKRCTCCKIVLICLIVGAIILGFVVVAIALGVSLQSNSEPQPVPDDEIRLPTDLEPLLYHIHLTPDLDTLAVTGTATIMIKTLSATNKVVLHSKDMTISSTSLKINNDVSSIKSTYFQEEKDFLVIENDGIFKVGDNIELSLEFNYTLRDDLVGFYLSTYRAVNGDTVRLASTQFESTDARTAFPCFDEPAMKSNFSITITHSNEYTATSNMPVKKSTKQHSSENIVTTEFETSYRMSTYLIAFVVSDFKCTDPPSTVNDRIEVRICSSPAIFNLTLYAKTVALDVIAYYEELFEVNYPLPKLDMFAIPDFDVGGMENWGLITYRETALLYDPSENPPSSKQRVALVIAHELAHQWFGNLVTMAWWDGLWLNEGFASYVEYIGMDHKEPDWKMLEQFFVVTIQSAYKADGLNWSHPIIQDVSNPNEINGLFDSISYDKGASLIRMLLNFIGKKSFTQGLSNYLNKYKFSNADTDDLWEVFNEVADDLTVKDMMDTWTKQMGYPVITLSSNGNTLSYKQERFFTNPPSGDIADSPYEYKWVIPFTYIKSSNPDDEQKSVLQDRNGDITVQLSTGQFIKANVKQNGFYRVNYDSSNWQAIIDYLRSSSFSDILSGVDRAGLIDDAFALSSAGLLNITTALDLSLYLQREREYVPWAAFFYAFKPLSNRLSLSAVNGEKERYISFLINNTLLEYPFDGSNLTHLESLLQLEILSNAWTTGNAEVANDAKNMFDKWMKNTSSIVPPNLRKIVYPAGIALGEEEEWQFLWERYFESTDPYEQSLYLTAMAYSTEPWILNRYLEYSLDKVRSQDTVSVIEQVSRNVHGRYIAWNFFRDNYDYLFDRYGGGSFAFSGLIKTLTASFSTEWELHEVESFFEEHPDAGSGALAVEQSKEVIRGNIQWVEQNLDTVNNWIDSNIPQ